MRDGHVEAVRPARYLERDGVPGGDAGRLLEGNVVAATVYPCPGARQLPSDPTILSELPLELRLKEVLGCQMDRALADNPSTSGR